MKEELKGEIILYQTENSVTKIEVRLEDSTVWLTQQQLADLYQTSRTNVVEHIKHIFEEEELVEHSTCRNFRQVQTEGLRSISHKQALEKAKTEYKKYQAKNLTPVEKAYLENIKALQKKINP